MIVWQLQCYLDQIRMLQEDMILDYKKVERSTTYVNSFSLIKWLTSGILYRSMWCMLSRKLFQKSSR